MNLVAIRYLLSIAAVCSWDHRLDVHNAILHWDLDEGVYMILSPGCVRQGRLVFVACTNHYIGLSRHFIIGTLSFLLFLLMLVIDSLIQIICCLLVLLGIPLLRFLYMWMIF